MRSLFAILKEDFCPQESPERFDERGKSRSRTSLHRLVQKRQTNWPKSAAKSTKNPIPVSSFFFILHIKGRRVRHPKEE